LNEKLQQALRSLPLKTVIKIDDIGGLKPIFQGAVANAGFKVDPGVANHTVSSPYQLAASLEAQQPIVRDNWHWLRATLKIELIAQDGVSVIGYQSWPLKVSAGSAAQLQPRLIKSVDKKLKQELLNSVLGFVT
jgi:hypothetical protein